MRRVSSDDVAHRDRAELALDAVLGVSVWIWAAGLFLHDGGPPLAVRLSVALLNGGVGALFLWRGPARTHGDTRALLSAIPSIALGGIALRIAPSEWPIASVVVFVAMAIGALASLLTLGRSFSILPARREVVGRGPYRVVRHPAYACELGMVIAAGAASAWWIALVLGALVLLTLVPRIRAEEALLAHDDAWSAYATRTRHRLVPGVW
ncbi:methyltransferase family protein [Sandaracinus amylolyticus]|uniref:Isoprenylcysteine carboxylmethyltransferase family protein n=1 Tax=Sandaracinus amylolyticus TaxID=927083 RepID=A0A0F6VZW1_9BACT|nr:isoprenylcysteine carboxylmethyltransferase family protein [Sandaracinus amylolyticus]AKF03880.1 hypothetical protein DB32_001029 [Sandaracinus amylolyticus]